MKIAAMAAGAVGGYFGARLAAAGHEVAFVARGRLLEALRRDGLRIESTAGDLHLSKVTATSDPADIGPVDVMLFAVKLWDTEIAGEMARPLVGPDTRVIALQNGVDSVERLAPIVGDEQVAAGTAYIASVMAEPGMIHHTSAFARLACGRVDGKPDAALAAFVQAAQAAGIDATLSPDMQAERWQKFTFLVGLAGVTAGSRHPLGEIIADPDGKALLHDLMREVVAVGRARGVAIAADYADDRLAFAEKAPASMKASLLHDLERGNRLELDWLTGKVVALGREAGVPTPANSAVYAVLKPFRGGKT